ncbi:hypothetical protein B0J12DRAFT_705599 [Macrophomina phaseolina]|uniref:RING-type domain-containing protein n=1 Tax=Macrophomina phaseolina TaxID=35725 RepID=A0ABQ8FRQ0_9PEZI|nr:hypothetical protein B0J12DRAFT_705599 [Macrophomina phaseolina]
MSSAKPNRSSSRSPSRRAAIGRWFATAMARLRPRRPSPSRTTTTTTTAAATAAAVATTTTNITAIATARPPRTPSLPAAAPLEAGPPASPILPPAPARPPPSVPGPDPSMVRPPQLATGRALVTWLPPAERRCQLCRSPYEGANTELERSTPREEREQAARVAGCSERPTAHVVGRRCLEQWLEMGGMEACPLCAFSGAMDE